MPKIQQAEKVGELVAEKAKAAGVTAVVFDRNGYLYHGRVQVSGLTLPVKEDLISKRTWQ